MKKPLRILLLLWTLSTTLFPDVLAQTSNLRVQQLPTEQREVYFTFQIADRSEIATLTHLLSIDDVRGNQVWAYANRTQFLQFLQLHKPYEVLTAPSLERPAEMLNSLDERDLNLTAYPTYPQYVQLMQNFAAQHPNICRLHNIGSSVEGRDLLIVKITDNPDVREYEPQFLYTSTMHGDETAGYILMLDLIDWLLTGYGTDPEATELINTTEIWINPNANPDGTYAAGNNTVNGATRANANGVDLNRNYPDPQDGPHPDGNPYQPETIAFMAFADTMDFVLAANFHGGAEVWNYPWDTKAADHADRSWWISTGQQYVSDVHAVTGTSYFADLEAGFDEMGITNGFAWYEVNGGRQDYMNTWRHCREVTIELSTIKLIPASDFDNKWNANKQALINYMKMPYQGFHGIVTDACTGEPVKSKIFVNNHDLDSSHVYTSLPIGNYYRPISEGNYSVTYSAPGYVSQTITVNVGAAPQEILIALEPEVPQAAFMADAGNTCGAVVQFTDASGSAESWLWNFGDGSTSTEQHPLHAYAESGTYDVTLTVTNCAGTNTTVFPAAIDATVTPMPQVSESSLFSCAPSTFTLNASGSGILRWFTSESGGTPVATGNTFTTPLISANTTYYVENAQSGGFQNVGATTNAFGTGGFYTGPTYHYLIFDAMSAFTLNSVTVYANTAGNRTIQLRDASGTVLQSATVSIPAGQSEVPLNFSVPEGNGWQLGTAGQNNLYRNQTGASYPYMLDGIVQITGNSAANNAFYYFFYNWKIEQSCTSPRVPIHLEIGQGSLLSASLNNVPNAVCVGQPLSFEVTTNAVDANFYWTVNGNEAGDNSAVLTINPTAGSYNVSCMITTVNSCEGTVSIPTETVTVAVNDVPMPPTISFNEPDQLLSSASAGNQWYLNGVAIDGATGSTYIATENGLYSATVAANGCTSAASSPVSVLNIGITDAMEMELNIYPNPAKGLFVVESATLIGAQLHVRNVLGQLVYATHINNSLTMVDAGGWSTGQYFVTITSGKEVIVRKLRID